MKDKYEIFFDEIKKFTQEQTKQKQRGLNDYNLLTTVLKTHDEVRLHSRVIGSLLNQNGKHYQGSLFLDIFLEKIGLADFGINTSKTKLILEYKNIDLYLSDGLKHIILENKVYAGDQASQIKRYIKEIKKENQEILEEDIYVIYLSIDRERPSYYSLGKEKAEQSSEYFEITDNKLKYIGLDKDLKDFYCAYKSIHYKTEILEWLDICEYEVQNITNLSESLKQYREVVEKITKNYKSKVKQMDEVILKDRENFELAHSIFNEFDKSREKIVNKFYTDTLINGFRDRLDKDIECHGWDISVDEKKLNDKWSYPIRVYKDKDWKIVFSFSFAVKGKNKCYWTICSLDENFNLNEFRENHYANSLNKIDKKTNRSIVWNYTEYMYSYDIKNLVKFQFEKESVIDTYYEYFKSALKTLVDNNTSLEEINSLISH